MAAMIELDSEQQAAREWFETLRDRICAEFEAIERDAGSASRFAFTEWAREDEDGSPGGGGMRGLMKGKVFDKVGVKIRRASCRERGCKSGEISVVGGA